MPEQMDILDKIEVDQVKHFLVGLREYLATNKPKYGEIIRSTNTFTEEAETLLKQAIKDYTEEFLANTK